MRGPMRRDAQQAPPDRNEPRVNERIRVPRVYVVDDAGEKLGEMDTIEALAMARDRGMDLVEVAPTARPPVCKIADFGKLKYEKKKRETEARKNQVIVDQAPSENGRSRLRCEAPSGRTLPR